MRWPLCPFIQILFVRTDHTAQQAPTALQYRSPHTGRIIDRIDVPADRCLVSARKHLNGHDLHAVVIAGTARNAADTDTVVVHRSDRSCHMRSMSDIIGIRPCYIPLVLAKL